MPEAAFPDGEDVVMALLDPAVAKAVHTTPPEENWVPTEPLIRVLQTGGTSDRLQTRLILTVEFFAPTYSQAKALAAQGEQIILAAARKNAPNGVFVDRTEILASPREVTYQDPAKRRKTLTCRLTMRR